MAKIIVIEDDSDIRQEVMDWLRFEGYDVIGAPNGRVGLELIDGEAPDLILCDIAMPELDGHGVLIEVRAKPHLSTLPFIFLTASNERSSMRRSMELGADDYITKPFTRAEVLSAIWSRLEKNAAQTAQIQSQVDTISRAFAEEHEKRLLNSRVVAMLSHDFRNPLATILSSTQVLERYDDRLDSERRRVHLHRIGGSVYLLLQMLDDMLTVAEMEGGHLEYVPQPVDLASFVDNIVEEFRLIDQGMHRIVFDYGFRGSIDGDPKLLRQILSNLLSNALKYSPPEAEVRVALSQDESGIHLLVQDQGMGIPEEALPRLFEPFYRAPNAKNVKGTGLGLSIVRQCVELHGGKIAVQSDVSRGTCFVVTLPAAQSAG